MDMALEYESKILASDYFNKRKEARMKAKKPTTATDRFVKRSNHFCAYSFLMNDKNAIRLLDDLGFIKHWRCERPDCAKFESVVRDVKQK